MTLELTQAELDVFSELVERRLKELRVEIHRTESTSYREKLDQESEVLNGLAQRLPDRATFEPVLLRK